MKVSMFGQKIRCRSGINQLMVALSPSHRAKGRALHSYLPEMGKWAVQDLNLPH